MLDMMISENATQAKDNAPSACDGVAAAVKFIAMVVMSDDASNEGSTIVDTLFEAHKSSIGLVRADLIAKQYLGRRP